MRTAVSDRLAAAPPIVLPRADADADATGGGQLRVLVAAGVGVLLGAVAVTLKIQDGSHPAADTALSAVSGALFLAAGLLAHLRRPANGTGLLMLLVGAGFFAEDLQLARDPVLFTVGLLCTHASTPFVVLLVLAFPAGRLPSRSARLLTGITFGTVFGAALLGGLFVDWAERIPGKPADLLLVADSQTVAVVSGLVVEAVGVAVAAGVVGSLAYRYRAGAHGLRNPLAPALLIAAVTGAASGLASLAGSDSPLYPALLGVYRVGFCLWPLAFLLGAVSWRPARTAIADLLGAVGNPVAPAELRDLLAGALRDPELRLARWHPRSARYLDTAGRPVDPAADQTTVTLAGSTGAPIGLLVRRVPPWEDTRLTDAVARLVGLVLDNQRLATEAATRLAEVRASRARLVSLADRERRRMERDLHDGAQQRLVIAALSLRLAQRRLPPDADPALAAQLAQATADLTAAISQLRELARGIHPALLTDAGLPAAVHDLAERTPLPVTLTMPALPRLPAEVEATAYFVVAEALTNAVKHAAADRADVHIGLTADRLRVEIVDDGCGGASLTPGSGLAGLRDRVRALDGELTIGPGPAAGPGTGTTVRAEIPTG